MFAVPDSGIFLDVIYVPSGDYNFRYSVQNFMNFSNKEVDPVETECVKDN